MKKIITLLAVAFYLNTNAQIITTIAGGGSCGSPYCGDEGQATAAELYQPYGVAFDAMGNMYIADNENNRIRKVSTSGIITTFAGTGTHGYSGDGGQATAAELYTPTGVAFDAVGNLYIVDEDNFVIRKVTTAGIITTVAGNNTGGYSGDGGQATDAELLRPYGLSIDAMGNLYISDTQNNRIRKVNTTGIITTIAGNGTAAYSGDGGLATAAEINNPSGIGFDAAGNIYIVDSYNNRIRMINTSGIITTIAGTGTGAYSGDGGQATVAELKTPRAIAISLGNLYIADEANNRIRKINTSGIITTIAGNGTVGFSGDGGQAAVAEFNLPTGIIFDGIGNLYVTDYTNNRIRKITNVATEGINQFANNIIELNIYPNPNNGRFVIELNNPTRQTIQIYDVNGKLVLTQILNGKTNIDARSLNEGVYNMNIISDDGVVNKKLMIIR